MVVRKSTRSPLFYGKSPGGLPSIIDTSQFSGNIFYVDSNGGGGDTAGFGSEPDKAHLTIDFAIGQCTADQGDVILVMPGHAETLAAVITLDKAGVKIIGMGPGLTRPQLTVAGTIDGIDITADDCVVENIYFNEATSVATSNINVAAARVTLRGIHMDVGDANNLLAITVTAAGELPTMTGLTFTVTGDGPDTLVKYEGVVDRPIHEDWVVVGSDGTDALDIAVIDYNSQAVTNPITRNCMFNGGGIALTVVANAGSVVAEATGPNLYAGLATGADNVTPSSSGNGSEVPGFGTRVTKVSTLASDPDDLFDVTGKVMITLMTGEVTTVVATTTTAQLLVKTSGEALSAATTITSDADGTMYLVSGQPDALFNGALAPTPLVAGLSAEHDSTVDRSPSHSPLIVGNAGGSLTIEQDLDGAGTGAITWDLWFIPLEAGATVVAAA